MAADITMFRTYALMDPADIPQSIKLCHTETSFTLHDLYPKSLYHEVVIPLIRPPLTVDGLRDLRSLLSLPTEVAKTVLLNLRRDALEAKRLIEDDMRKRYSAVWDVQIGFHALPSVQHLHLHVMSTDFTGLYFKNKKHLNSFHPDAGFFLKIDEVLEWFDLPQAEFARKARIDKKEHEALLKQDLKCPGCNAPFRSMTTVRKHLTEKHEKNLASRRANPANGGNEPGGGDGGESSTAGAGTGTGVRVWLGTSPRTPPRNPFPVPMPNIVGIRISPLDSPPPEPTSGDGPIQHAPDTGRPPAQAGSKRRHGHNGDEAPEGGGEGDIEGDGQTVIDVDALPDPPPARKRARVPAASS